MQMNGSWARLAIGAIAGAYVLGGVNFAVQAATPPTPPTVSARAVELMDPASGQVLYAYHAGLALPMASLTKVMTLFLTMKSLQQGKIRLDEPVPVSDAAYRIEGSQIWLEPGEMVTVEQLLKAIAVGSANDAAYALGEFLGGSEHAFVTEMNRTAERLGMRHTHFANAHGLNMPDHHTTAADMAILARAALRVPGLLHYTSLREDRSIRNGKGGTLWLINHNRLLRQYAGADGLKTGYTREAGYCVVATARRAGQRMVAVVLGAPSSKVRFEDAATLMTWGFQHFATVRVANPGQTLGEVPVRRGTARRVRAVVPDGFFLTLPQGAAKDLKTSLSLVNAVTAPVERGQPLGQIVARQGARVVGRRTVVAAARVGRAHWLGRAFEYWQRLIG